jgi:hypothetical protein
MAGTRAIADDDAPLVSYEQRLSLDRRWALIEGSRHFEKASAVHDALLRITHRLDEIGVPYAIADGMALFEHGVRRFTEDVDILVTKDGLKAIHEQLSGLGYVRAFPGSKNLRDTEHGVRIEFLITGHYPGDGKPKPVRFPDPAAVWVERDGIKYLGLAPLIELKLASGISSADRGKDLADVQELIKTLSLPADFAGQLDATVRDKFAELRAATRTGKRYMTLWRNKHLTTRARTIDDMIAGLHGAAATLEAMRADGVVLDPDGIADDYARLVTTDPDVARKYDMQDEREFWGEDPGDTDDQPR